MRIISRLGFCFLALVLVLRAQSAADEMDSDLIAYFTTEDGTDRADIAARVAGREGATVERIAGRLHHLPLWFAAEPGNSAFGLDLGDGQPRDIHVRIPPAYDPSRPWPLMISLHGTRGRAKHALAFAASFLAERADEMIVAAPQGAWNGPFNIHDELETDQPVRVLRALRRRYHIDSNRVFLTGYSKGGHRACSASVMFADQFAGSLPLAGSMVLPQGQGLFPQFLPNLRYLPMLMVWGALDTKGPSGRESTTGGIAGINRLFAEAVRQSDLRVTAFEYPDRGHGGILPPADELAALLDQHRVLYPPQVSHWFRYPGQGRAYWLRLVAFQGEPWSDARIHVELKRGDDPHEAFLRATRRRMGKLQGSIEGQTVTVRSKRVKVVEVLLHDGLIDLDRPVRIKLNGRRAFDGLLERRVETLLELAASDWDFDRVFSARVSIALGRRGRQQ